MQQNDLAWCRRWRRTSCPPHLIWRDVIVKEERTRRPGIWVTTWTKSHTLEIPRGRTDTDAAFVPRSLSMTPPFAFASHACWSNSLNLSLLSLLSCLHLEFMFYASDSSSPSTLRYRSLLSLSVAVIRHVRTTIKNKDWRNWYHLPRGLCNPLGKFTMGMRYAVGKIKSFDKLMLLVLYLSRFSTLITHVIITLNYVFIKADFLKLYFQEEVDFKDGTKY